MKTKFNGILTLLLAFVVQLSFAQEKTISGTVVDETNMPLPGATVVIKGTQTGASTDFDGNYSISANEGDVLTFSYVGYADQDATVGASNSININLVLDNALEDIVITGVAGATSRKKLSVTVNKVSAKDLENAPTSSAASALQGKVAGATVTNMGQPGSGATIQLRGATNLFGSQSPLVIVDGVIVEGGLSDVSSDDIASYEIVKGASASALYGSRAGNGVIVITTKKGKVGKTIVTLKSEVGASQLNHFLELSNSHHYALASDYYDHQGVYTSYNGVNYPADYNGSNYANVTGARVEDLDHYADNPYGVYFDTQKDFFRTGLNVNTYASVSTATDNSNLFFSVNKNNTEGILKETKGYEQVSARLNGEIKINDWLKFSAHNQFVRSFNNTPGGSDGIFFDLSVTDPDVNLNAVNTDGQPYLYVPSLWNSTTSNPIYPLYANPELTKKTKFLGGYNLNIKMNDMFNVDLDYSIESVDAKRTDYTSSSVWTGGGTQQDLYATYSTGNYYMYHYRNTSQKAQATLNFKKEINDLTITSKLSYLVENSLYEDFDAYGTNEIFAGATVSLDNYTNTFISSDTDKQVAKNFFGIVGLDYKDRYILDAMYRRDSSSLFGENNRTNDYYRVSGAYRITKDFEIPGVQEMKVHAAMGTAGQRPSYNWQYNRIPLSNGNLGLNRIKGNPDLRPSTTTEVEFGLSADFLDRFHLEAVHSSAKTEDQFMLVDIFPPANAGSNRQWQNIGTVSFSTLELAIDAKVMDKGDFKWDMGLVFEKTNNEITELNVNAITVGPDNGEVFRIQEGVEFGTMFGRSFVTSLDQMAAQLPAGMTIDDYSVNADGVVVETATIGSSSEAAIILLNADGSVNFGEIGKATPDFKMGIRNNVSYKGFNFYMLWDMKSGGDIYNRNGQWLTRDNRSAMVDQAGVPAGQKKTVDYYQSLYDVNQNNGFWVEDGSYVKLREASLFYTFDKDQLKGIANEFFSSLRIGLTGTNLLTFTEYSGWDPEVQTYDSDTLQYYSVDYNAYPVNSTYTLSFTLKF